MATHSNGLNRGEFREWLVEMFKQRDLPPKSIAVRHTLDGGEKGQEIQSVPVTKEQKIDDYVRWAARVIDREAKAFGGLQRFGVFIYHTDSEHHTGRYGVTVLADPIEDENGDFANSEPANQKGFLAQAMRHVEVRHQQSHNVEVHASGVLERQINTANARIEYLEKERTEMIKRYEEAESLKHEREMRQKEFEAKEVRMKQVMDLLMMLGPTIVNRMAGKKLLPEKTDPRVEMLRSFMASLDDKQIEQLQTVFRKEQFIVLADVWNQFAAEEAAELAKSRQAAGVGGGDGSTKASEATAA